VAGPTGLEPAASCVTGRSSQNEHSGYNRILSSLSGSWEEAARFGFRSLGCPNRCLKTPRNYHKIGMFPGSSMIERSAVNYTAEHHKLLFWRRSTTKLSPLTIPRLRPTTRVFETNCSRQFRVTALYKKTRSTHVALRWFTSYLGVRLGFRRFYPASLGESHQN
jgi:hypothetical protein